MASAHPVTPILNAFAEGYSALLLSGRPPSDLVADSDGEIRPFVESLRRQLYERNAMAFISYSMAAGLDWNEHSVGDERDRRTLSTILRSHGLLDIPPGPEEVPRVIRGISSLCRMPASAARWSDGREMHLAFFLQFGEHLTPGGLTNGTQTEAQIVSIELAHLTGHSLALRSSGNLVILHGREGMLDSLVDEALHPVRIPLPDYAEKIHFLASAQRLYPQAGFERGLEPADAAGLTANTSNRGLESLLRASHRRRLPVTALELTAQKSRDVECLSEGTLTALDTRRVDGLRLVGRNIATPMRILSAYSASLLRGDPSTPANALLTGAPGTGKTDLALLTAAGARAAAYQMHSPKGGIVGETERKSRIQQTVAREWTPNVCFADEITEMLPVQRSEHDGDSGASRAVLGSLLTALSDESRRGKSLLIASTNCPWRMGEAMRSRFDVIPVLQPLAEDYPEIVAITVLRIDASVALENGDERVREAAHIFQHRGANPRHIRASLSHARLLRGHLDAETTLTAARNFTGANDRASAIYADLWAIRACTCSEFLPWHGDPAYPFPDWLQGIVGPDGEIAQTELSRRIREFGSHANV